MPRAEDPKGLVHILAALVNAQESPEVETVTILNASPHPVDLGGWALLDTRKNRQNLSGQIGGGEARTIRIEKPVELSNKGGIITIIDEQGLKVDGVSYTKEEASHSGWTIVF